MTVPEVVLDTDILSAIMRRNPLVLPRARLYLSEHGRFTISLITRYEILRGLKARAAEKQVLFFDRFCSMNTIVPLTDAAAVEAAEIYADLSSRGALIPDADILIAASAIAHGLGVATNNVGHFNRIHGLHVENWLTDSKP